MFLKEFKKVTLYYEGLPDDYFDDIEADEIRKTKEVELTKVVDGEEVYLTKVIYKILRGVGEFSNWVPSRKDRSKLVVLFNETRE